MIWGVPPRSRIWLHELEMFYLTNRIRNYSFGWALNKWTSLFLHTAAIACGLGGWCMRVTAGVMKCGAAMCQTNQSWEYTCPHRPSPATRWDRGQAALSSYDSLHPSSSHVHIICTNISYYTFTLMKTTSNIMREHNHLIKISFRFRFYIIYAMYALYLCYVDKNISM